MRRSPLLSSVIDNEAKNTPSVCSGTYVISQAQNKGAPSFHPVTGILSSLPRSDLLVLSADSTAEPPLTRTLPVSPYPAHPGAVIRAHFVVDAEPNETGWHPWVGGLWSKWVRGTVLGYRDFAGREAKVSSQSSSHALMSKRLFCAAWDVRRALPSAL